ncbi:MAG TPA: carbohydrate kinase [Planctomycetes bacterium]|nr:carbohydrate kinase [Planctomycetota bacterium]
MMRERFLAITSRYAALRVALAGDFCLDRYLEIDPSKAETSLETGLPVHNVVRVRSQPGGAGTILNNLEALGAGAVHTVGFCGEDGEGFELLRALESTRGVRLDYFVRTPARRTFTYCKPLVVEAGRPPVELNRLDSKNWTPTPPEIEARICDAVESLAAQVDALVILEQVDLAETGVVTRGVLECIGRIARARPGLLVLADSRRSLEGWPPVCLKMNRTELAKLAGLADAGGLASVRGLASDLARSRGTRVFVTLGPEGLLGAMPDGSVEHVPALPARGPIDIVGAGDAVSANLACALAAGASLREALKLAGAAASVVIHKLGTTGAATPSEIAPLLCKDREVPR